MYEKPNLNCVGAAQNVILGYILMGTDLDSTWMHGQGEFAFDGDDQEHS